MLRHAGGRFKKNGRENCCPQTVVPYLVTICSGLGGLFANRFLPFLCKPLKT
jgi:hypothetical protein